ncbi:MAG TPA: cupin domain-containing protein [Candidatus Babeliales bacterium]|nr:cupin domain-containing protein [Candidatus Babeliales bacterium]
MVNYVSTPERQAYQINPQLIVFPVVPLQAEQGWRLGLFEMSGPIVPHYHKLQRQIAIVVEGKVHGRIADEHIVLNPGDIVTFNPGIIHELAPEKKAQFLRIDLPGLDYRDDIFFDAPEESCEWKTNKLTMLPPLDPQFFPSKIDCGDYAAYDLFYDCKINGEWSASLLEINDSPKHYHRIGLEIFVVVNGQLAIEIDGCRQILNVGESVTLLPGMVHHLKSSGNSPVRVLCFNFPAFDQSDMHIL